MTPTLEPPRAPEAHRAHQAPRPVAPRPVLQRRHVGIVIGLLVGAVVMLAAATLDELSGTRVPVLSTLAAAPVPEDSEEASVPTRTAPPATPGSCLTWQRTDAADAETVDCSRSHLFEQAGAVQLSGIPANAAMPDNQRFRQLVNERCTPLVVRYLGGKYDPNGAFRAGALRPSPKSWADGDRLLRCGLQRFSRSGALYAITGKVSAQDQADIRPTGTCLGIDGRYIGDPVDCSLPHAIEAVGSIDLGQKFHDKFPQVSDQDAFLQPACSKMASDYAGGEKVISDKKLSVLWDNLTVESWAAGTRKVACNLAAQLPDRSGFAPVTGSVRGPVQVGDKPAPPSHSEVPPGAPAPGAGKDADVPEPDDAAPAPAESQPNQPSPSEAPPPVKLPDDKLPGRPPVLPPVEEVQQPSRPGR